MYTGIIVRVGETAAIAKINTARANFGYQDEDIVAILKNGRPVQVETIGGIEAALNTSFQDIETALTALLAHLESQV